MPPGRRPGEPKRHNAPSRHAGRPEKSRPGRRRDSAHRVLSHRAMAQSGTWGSWIRQLGREQRRLRRALGLSEDQFARLAAVDCSVVHALETAEAPVAPLPVMLKINL